jgi:hypothetical protein
MIGAVLVIRSPVVDRDPMTMRLGLSSAGRLQAVRFLDFFSVALYVLEV